MVSKGLHNWRLLFLHETMHIHTAYLYILILLHGFMLLSIAGYPKYHIIAHIDLLSDVLISGAHNYF